MKLALPKLSKDGLERIIRSALDYSDIHKPAILAAMGIGLSYTAVYKSAHAGIKAKERVEEAQARSAKLNPDKEFTRMDTVKAAAPAFVETALLSAASTGCIIAGAKISHKRELAAWSAYSIAKESYDQYKQATEETLSKKKAENIQTKADELLAKTVSSEVDGVQDGGGTVLCIDAMSGRKFLTNYDKIKMAEALLNQRLYEEVFVSLNELYDILGIDPNDIGELIGWNNEDCPVSLTVSTQLTEDGKPCMVLRSNELTTKYQHY